MLTTEQRRRFNDVMQEANALADLAEGIAMSQVRLLTANEMPSPAYAAQADEVLRRAHALITALHLQQDACYRS